MKILIVIRRGILVLIVFLIFLTVFHTQISYPLSVCARKQANNIEKDFVCNLIYYYSLNNKFANGTVFKQMKLKGKNYVSNFISKFNIKKSKGELLYFGDFAEHIGGIRIYDINRNLIWDFYFSNAIFSCNLDSFPQQITDTLVSNFIKNKKICGFSVFSENEFNELILDDFSGNTGANFKFFQYKHFKRYEMASSYLFTQWPFKGFPKLEKFSLVFDYKKLNKKNHFSFPILNFLFFYFWKSLCDIFDFPETYLIYLIVIEILLFLFPKLNSVLKEIKTLKQ
ncbi:hypothetical protein TTHT_2015 [Thermotomaculum hydrothermale]|uniref:Uncharacterized protein n=1 Tax=Thermotomaculum hydrothermale TaxID=981385 RepID=A0A7R6PNQ3_9BACT|nr:hypothetical protein [Thermotomaculum hydrothermale]BBB33457.1 hypothetical protein TTHT_2015 [Thermotomaculum hydrothermale]